MSRLRVSVPVNPVVTSQPQRRLSGSMAAVTSSPPERHSSGAIPIVKPSLTMPAVLMPAPQYPIRLVVMAASTGGPAALSAFFEALPAQIPAPIVVVQHMAEQFLPSFVDRLAQTTRLKLLVAQGRELIYPGQVWFAPTGRHLITEPFGRGLRLRLADTPPVNGCRPAADETLASAVKAVGGHVLAVVLSGIGRDGRDGCRLLKAAGGHVLVQDSASAAVAEMPESVAKEMMAEGALPPAELALRVGRKLAYGR